MSTSRKLIKISEALETLPQPKRIFRTKRGSETGMANVDSVAAETLVTDRFQTLYGEGKTERIRENSPVKQSYERMQSGSIPSSARFSSSNRLPSKDFNSNGERKFVNLPSLMLSPTSPLSGSVVEPEDILFSSLGSPRDSSSPQLLKYETNLESPQRKSKK